VDGDDERPEGEESLFDHAGGEGNLHRLEEIFYDMALADPILREVFPQREPTHVDHLTSFTAESFGGPADFTRTLGFGYLIAVHRGLKITEEQRSRFVDLYLRALDIAGMPDDQPFRVAVREHLEFGSQVAVQNSWAESDDELHPIREVPLWTW
jgi:hemoglobin